MMRGLLVFLLFASPALALDQPIYNQMNAGNTASARFGAFMNSIGWGTPRANAQAPFPSTGGATVVEIICASTTDPAGTATWTVALEINGTPNASNCVINHGTTTGTSGAVSIAIAGGNLLDWALTPANTPAAGSVSVAALLRMTNSGEMVLMGATNGNIGAATVYYPPVGGNLSATEPNSLGIAPGVGTATRFCFNLATAPGALQTRDITFRIEAAASSLAVQYAGALAAGVVCDTGTDSISADGRLAVETVDTSGSSTASTGGWGIVVQPQTDGDTWQLFVTAANADNTLVVYPSFAAAKGTPAAAASENSIRNYVNAWGTTVKTMRVRNTSGPGVAKSFVYVLRDNNADVAAFTTTITGASNPTISGVTPTAYALTDGHYMDVSITPSGTPGLSRFQIGFITHINVTASTGAKRCTLLGVC